MFHTMHENYCFSNRYGKSCYTKIFSNKYLPSIVPLMSDEILMKDKITKDKKCQKFQSSSSVFFKACVTKILKSKVMYQRKN